MTSPAPQPPAPADRRSEPGLARRLAGLLLRDYGMALVLLLLCIYYSWATWGIQYRDGADAARDVLDQLSSAPAPSVLLVAHKGQDAQRFIAAAKEGIDRRNVAIAQIVEGDPSTLRQAIERLDAAGTRFKAILATREAGEWRILQNFDAHFPQFQSPRLLLPRSFRGPDFLRLSNLAAVGDRIVVIAIIAIGMTMVILTGGIDLSVGSLIALASVVAAWLIQARGGAWDAPIWIVILSCAAGVFACALVGLFTGGMVTVFRIPPFIVTLAVMLIARGVARRLTSGESVYQLPASITALGRGVTLGVTNSVLVMAGLYVVAHIIMSRTLFGRYVYAIGGNRKAAFLSGVPVRRIIAATYAIAGALAGLGGVIETSRLQSGAPIYGNMAELSVIAAVVVGGTSLSGGKGTIFGTLIGCLIIAVIENGMNLTGVSPDNQMIVLGAVILGAVLLDILRNPAQLKEWA